MNLNKKKLVKEINQGNISNLIVVQNLQKKIIRVAYELKNTMRCG